MQPSSCEDLVTRYLEWLRSKITVSEIAGVCEITTPFLDRHNDYVQIYVRRANGLLVLTDDGYTMRDLATSGCEITSPRRKEILQTILNGFGVRLEDDELTVEARLDDFPQKKHALLQAMLAVDDMFMTARSQVASLFLEDVERYLRVHSVRFVPNVQFTGKSGFVHTFDFAIPSSDARPERILRAFNQPDRNSVIGFLFAWNDTREVRSPQSQAYAVLNDSERSPTVDVLSALKKYGCNSMLWSQRDQFLADLAA
ncbi:MAG: DUF1828 domain-containing protein [Planctomycetes bacterium]|nr:DUF1828 domain-containing protein [Planctomycetota bacterium]